MSEKKSILVSACLLGACCRYDGKGQKNEAVAALAERYHLIPVCPEQLGGLPTPRTPAERKGERVITKDGRDVTEEYRRGAQEALKLARLFGCEAAVLKARSPSCGSGEIYDGTFSGKKCAGNGVCAQLLLENGLRVFSEETADALHF